MWKSEHEKRSPQVVEATTRREKTWGIRNKESGRQVRIAVSAVDEHVRAQGVRDNIGAIQSYMSVQLAEKIANNGLRRSSIRSCQ